MRKVKTNTGSTLPRILTLVILCFFSIVKQVLAQDENGIDEQRKTIVNVNDSLVKLSDHVYAILSDGVAGNIAVYENPDGLVLVDDQWVELMPKVQNLLTSFSDKEVKYVINTHFHYDHTDGNKVLGKEGAIIISHDNIRKRLAERQVLSLSNLVQHAYPSYGLPFITFSESLTLHEPNEQIKIIHVKNAHTDGDSFIKFMDSNIIHTGDLFVTYGFPFIDHNNGGNIYGMIQAIDIILDYTTDSTKIIPGHGPICNKTDLISYQTMLQTVVNRVQEGIQNNLTIEQIEMQKPLENLGFAWDGYFNVEQIYKMVKMKLDNE